jgi:hypothetical protein
MATITDKTREDYQAELAALGGLLIDPAQTVPVKVPFVPCANVLLAQTADDPEIRAFYDQYFERKYHRFLSPDETRRLICTTLGDEDDPSGRLVNAASACLPPSCVTLAGLRGSATYVASPTSRIGRVFVGDLVWVFFLERMGVFKLFARLVDDYATTGQFPVETGDLTSVTLEVMVRQLKMGMASSARERTATYRRCLGWTSDVGRQLGIRSETSTAFHDQFHKLLHDTLRYNADKRLAKAIQLTTTGGSSAATRVAIRDTLVLLKESFKAFGYGRNYYNTLNAIVYAVAGLDLVRNVRSQIGIPSTYTTASQYVSAAYYSLIEGKAASESKPNRYLLHLACATSARDLLLDIEKLDAEDVDAVGQWIDNEIVEERVETYRKAYRDLTRIDLLESISQIEQAA